MSMFDTSKIDGIPDAEAVLGGWESCSDKLYDAATSLAAAKRSWEGLGTPLNLPAEMNALYRALDVPVQTAEAVKEKLGLLGREIVNYVDEVRSLRQRTAQVHRDIEAFYRRWPEGEDVGFWESFTRSDEAKAIKRDINRIHRAFLLADDRLRGRAVANTPDAVKAVPTYYPGGGDVERVGRAQRLADGLLNGSTSTPKADFEKLMVLLGEMSPRELEAFAQKNPRAHMLVPPIGHGRENNLDPGKNREWWDKTLTEEQRAAMIEHFPGIVGNLEGLTYADRSEANVKNLQIMEQRTTEQREGTRNWGLTDAQMNGFDTIRKVYNEYAGTPVGSQIASFDPNNEPKAAVVIGNLDTATHQSWYIPGMTSTAASMDGLFGDAEAIWKEQGRLGVPESQRAMVAWMGYDAPPMIIFDELNTDVIRNDDAREGGNRLQYALEGSNHANSLTGQPDRNITVIGHSYGTTTASYGLKDLNFKVDQAIFFGSVGVPPEVATTADGLQIEKGSDGRTNLYAATANGDWPARSAIWGTTTPLGDEGGRTDPTHGSFGSKVYSVEGNGEVEGTNTDNHTGRGTDDWWVPGGASRGHGYVDENTQSLRSLGLISIGRGDEVPTYQESEYHEQEYDKWRKPWQPRDNEYSNPPIR